MLPWIDGNDKNSLDETPRNGLEDPSKRGLWLIKAEQLLTDDKIELSHVVDELAFWFHREPTDTPEAENDKRA
jgi:hypothetical protein